MLIQYASEEFPNFKNEMPDIKDLETFYKASKKRFDSDPEFKEKA
jgi:arginyl-tRNA synthetase